MLRSLPESLDIEVLGDGLPVPGAFVDVVLSMHSKNPHTMVLGPANVLGRIVASRDDLLREADRNCADWVMDYSDLRKYFSGLVELKPVTPKRLAEMDDAYRRFKFFEYPVTWEQDLAALGKWFAEHRVVLLETRVKVVPSQVQVSVAKVTL
jgi:hypothetical protein